MKRWSKCWRRVVNRTLAKLLGPTDWFAWVEEKDVQKAFKRLRVKRHGETPEGSVKSFHFDWSVLSRKIDGFTFELTLQHLPEGTIEFDFRIPWLVGFELSIDIGLLEWIEKRVGDHGAASYGINVGRYGLWLGWHDTDEVGLRGFRYTFDWSDVFGEPQVTHTFGIVDERLYVQNASGGFGVSHHRLESRSQTTVTTWPRFWKRPKTQVGYSLFLNPPVAIPATGLAKAMGRQTARMGHTFVDGAETLEEAIAAVRRRIEAARQGEAA